MAAPCGRSSCIFSGIIRNFMTCGRRNLHSSSAQLLGRESNKTIDRSYSLASVDKAVNRILLKNFASFPALSPYSHKLLPATWVVTRGLRTEQNEEDRKLHFQYKDQRSEDHGWMIRLANENGYLSWCRNTYIATIAGGTIYTQAMMIPYAKEAGVLLIFMGSLNLFSGTASYIYNVLSLRQKTRMSGLSLVYQISMSLTHCMLWLGAMMIYLGYVEEESNIVVLDK